jgi:hypothetical protein
MRHCALIDLAVKSKLLLDSVDSWLLTQPTLINAETQSLLPVVRERQVLADGLARYLTILGVNRVNKEISLSDYVTEKYGEQNGKRYFKVPLGLAYEAATKDLIVTDLENNLARMPIPE